MSQAFIFARDQGASQPMALVLRYHKTFIDVAEVPEPRAQSCPPMRGQMQEADEALLQEAFCEAHVQRLMESQRQQGLQQGGEQGRQESVGSRGHPECCRRPCVHFARGHCADGASCKFCHVLDHPKSVCLDKQQRVFMKSLKDEDKLRLVLPHLQSKAKCIEIN